MRCVSHCLLIFFILQYFIISLNGEPVEARSLHFVGMDGRKKTLWSLIVARFPHFPIFREISLYHTTTFSAELIVGTSAHISAVINRACGCFSGRMRETK